MDYYMARTRGYCFTINNYTDDDEEFCFCYLPDYFEYVIYGLEVGENGTPHIQGYLYDSSRPVFSKIKKLLPRAHIENAKGSPQQNIKYCSKDGDFYEMGSVPSQGKRNDFEDIKEMIDEGSSLLDIARTHFSTFTRYNKGFKLYQDLLSQPRDPNHPPTVLWLWGATGVGKTAYAYENFNTVYIKDHTQWWDGYHHQEAIVIDDFDGKWPFRDLLRLLDRYPYQGQTKGSYIHINSPTIIITCDRPPKDVYDHVEPHELAQLTRRISSIRKLE